MCHHHTAQAIFQIHRWLSNTSEARIWHSSCFNNISLFMTVRHICSWQHYLLHRRQWALRKLRKFLFCVCVCLCVCAAKLATGQETALASTADSMLTKLDRQDTKEDDFWTLPRQGMTVLQNSCSTEKSVIYAGPLDQRWMSQHCRGALGDCPGSQQFLSFL